MNVTLANGLALVSRGQLSAGEVIYVSSPLQETGTATVNIETWFQRHELVSLVKACAISRKNHPGEGVGLFVSSGSPFLEFLY